jgi:crotonobetainyl-CoA:carnitine CoA-transferase CaiB-like acyl-CoA transferase
VGKRPRQRCWVHLGCPTTQPPGSALRELPVARATRLLASRSVPACRVVARPRPLRDKFLEDNGFTHLVPMPQGIGRVVNHHSRWPDAPEPRQSRSFEIGEDTAAVLSDLGQAS